MTDFFSPNNEFIPPYAFMDLDDTLFQTQRKMDSWQMSTDNLTVATVNKKNEPLSFFTQKQAIFFNWLQQTTELIPVTARDTEEILRVKLPFYSWQILTHGAVIVEPNGEILSHWQQLIGIQLFKIQSLIQEVITRCQTDSQLIITPHQEKYFINNELISLNVYVAIKHIDKDHQALIDFANQLPTLLGDFAEEFYVHINANNLAILPHVINKHHATRFLLENYLDNSRPCFGFGDSLADLSFLQLLDWYGTPKQGQLHEYFNLSY